MSHYKTLSKRGLALVLALVMLFTLLPVSALAEESENGINPQVETSQDAGINSFDALATAVKGASDVQQTVITLSDSFEASDSIIIGYKNIVLDLNGQTITTTSSKSLFIINNPAGLLTIKDSVGGGTVVCNKSSANLIDVFAGTFVLESGELKAHADNTIAVYIASSSDSNAIITGGRITADNGDAAILNGNSCTIEGGDISGKINLVDGFSTTTITGGTFTDKETVNNILEGSGYVLDETGSLTVDEANNNFAAKVGNKGYDTLQAAVDAGGEVKLLKDVTENIIVNGTVVLDLNGKVLNGDMTATPKVGSVVTNNGTLTVKDSVGGGEITRDETGAGNHSGHDYMIFNHGELTIEGGHVYSQCTRDNAPSVICNQGTGGKTATMLLNDGLISNSWGIVVKNDDYSALEMTGGKIQVTSDTHDTPPKAWAGIQNWTTATITGGEIEGILPIVAYSYTYGGTNYDSHTIIDGNVIVTGQIQAIKYSPSDTSKSKIEIKGGTFCNIVAGSEYDQLSLGSTEGLEGEIEVTGGTFSSDVSAYIADGYEQVDGVVSTDVTLSEDDVAMVNGQYFAVLQNAINAANAGDTVTLVNDAVESVIINNTITLDLNGHKLVNAEQAQNSSVASSDRKHTITVTGNGTLTVQGTGTVDNVSHGQAAIYNEINGTIILNGGTFTRSAEEGTSILGEDGKWTNSANGNSWYTITNLGSMTINDGVTISQGYQKEDGSWTGSFSSLFDSGWVKPADNTENAAATVTINGGTFLRGKASLKNDSFSTMTVNGGSFLDASNWSVNNYGNLIIHNGVFESVRSGLYNGSGSLTVSGGSFKYDSGLSGIFNAEGCELNVIGGQYANEDVKPYLAKGYTTKETADGAGMWEIVIDESSDVFVARIGNVGYETLQTAIDSALAGNTVVILKDVEESVVIAAEQDITLDLNGKTLSGSNNHTVINKGTLTITDSAFSAANGDESQMGKIVGVNYVYNNGKNSSGKIAVVNEETATCYIESGLITRQPYLAADEAGQVQNHWSNSNYTVQNMGTMYITGGLIVNNSTYSNLVVNFTKKNNSYIDGYNAVMNISGGMLRQDTMSALKNDPGAEMNISGDAAVVWRVASPTNYATNFYGTVNMTGGTIRTNGIIPMFTWKEGNVEFPGVFNISGNAKLECNILEANNGVTGDAYVTTSQPTINISGDPMITVNKLQTVCFIDNKMTVVENRTNAAINVAGGTFSSPVLSQYCADGYLPVSKGKAYGVAEGPLELSAEYLALLVGETAALTVKAPDNVMGINWEFDPNIIGFNPEDGTVTARGRGNATITAVVGNQKATCTVVVTQPVNSVTLDQETADMMVGGETVTLTATINPVYANDQTIVWTSSNPSIATVDQTGVITAVGAGTAVITATVGGQRATCTVTVAPAPVPPGPSGPVGGTTIEDPDVPLASVLPFDDVTEGQWFYDAAAYAYENKLMAGITDNLFDPQGDTTRGMIVTILYRLEGEPAVSGTSAFDDVAADQWYTNAVIWGTANKVVAGYGDSTYRPTQNITREELAAILYRYAELKGYDVTVTEGAALNFPDGDEVSEYARPAMLWAVEKGLINGMDNGTVSARSGATRAQVATILKGFCEKFVDAE